MYVCVCRVCSPSVAGGAEQAQLHTHPGWSLCHWEGKRHIKPLHTHKPAVSNTAEQATTIANAQLSVLRQAPATEPGQWAAAALTLLRTVPPVMQWTCVLQQWASCLLCLPLNTWCIVRVAMCLSHCVSLLPAEHPSTICSKDGCCSNL